MPKAFGVDRALALKDEIEQKLLSIEGVTGVDVGFERVSGRPRDRLAIRVFVSTRQAGQRAEIRKRIPNVIRGIRINIIEEEFRAGKLAAQ